VAASSGNNSAKFGKWLVTQTGIRTGAQESPVRTLSPERKEQYERVPFKDHPTCLTQAGTFLIYLTYTLRKEAVCFSYQTVRCHKPEGHNLKMAQDKFF
jgi:hypothetical protein